MTQLGGEWEWLIVDDHSRDDTFAVIAAAGGARIRASAASASPATRGSHVAITCGLHHVRGDAAVMMAADLQDPPETLGAMLERWRGGAQVVWAVAARAARRAARTPALPPSTTGSCGTSSA